MMFNISITLFFFRVKGLHSNMCVAQMRLLNYIKLFVGSYFPSLVVEPNEIEHVYPMSKPFFFLLEEGGYFHLQATKPDTVGKLSNLLCITKGFGVGLSHDILFLLFK